MPIVGVGEMPSVECIRPHHEPLRIEIPLSGFSADQIDAVREIGQREQRCSSEKYENRSESFLDRICCGSKTLFPTLTRATKTKPVMRAFDRIANHLSEREIGP